MLLPSSPPQKASYLLSVARLIWFPNQDTSMLQSRQISNVHVWAHPFKMHWAICTHEMMRTREHFLKNVCQAHVKVEVTSIILAPQKWKKFNVILKLILPNTISRKYIKQTNKHWWVKNHGSAFLLSSISCSHFVSKNHFVQTDKNPILLPFPKLNFRYI